MAFSPTIVPTVISTELKQACLKVAGNEKPYLLEVNPKKEYKINKCAYNAKIEAESVGGRIIFGWAIFIWENVMFDFIGHAVVEVEGQYYCVTPSIKADTKVLFLSDDSISFDFENPNSRLPSCEIPISKRLEVKKLLETRENIRTIKIKYPVSSGHISVTVEDAKALSKLENQQRELIDKVNYFLHPVKAKCPCGSGRQFKKCCRPHMHKAFG